MRHAYWGQEHSPAETEEFLRAENIPYTRMKDEDAVLDRVVDALESGAVVGWFQGRGEWGPRALGHRSIVADPRKPGMKDVVNTKIKFREPFRPFAPSVLVERASEIFELAAAERHMPARYMLYVVDVKTEHRERVAATTHVDGTARLQTVDREVSPLYYRLIERFESATGVPVVLNTSFNLKGEPIVNSPAQAYSTFSRSGMDMLVVGEHIVEKKGGRA